MKAFFLSLLLAGSLGAQSYDLIQANTELAGLGISSAGFCIQAQGGALEDMVGGQFLMTWDEPALLIGYTAETPFQPDWFAFDVINQPITVGGVEYGPNVGQVSMVFDFMIGLTTLPTGAPQPIFSAQFSASLVSDGDMTISFIDGLGFPTGATPLNTAVAIPPGGGASEEYPISAGTRVFNYTITPGLNFTLGDPNHDETVNLVDAIDLLGALFLGADVVCFAAGDVDLDGTVSLTDPILLLNHLFTSNVTIDEAGVCEARETDFDCVQEGCP